MTLLAFSRQDIPLWTFGFPFLLLAVAMAGQTYYTSKRGYVYCGRTATVEKQKSPAKYRAWLCFHIAMSLAFLGLSTFGLWL